jgi:multisubunit Na+/H+ antiporter MnhE subunit
MWIVEPEPLFSAKETRRHHIVAAAVAAVSAVFMLMTVVPDESPWKRWSGVVICAVLVVQSLWKAVRFPPTPRP